VSSQRKPAASAVTAAALALFFILLSAVGIYLVVTKKWWFPEAISTIAPEIDRQFDLTMLWSGIIFVLAQVALGVLIFLYRDRGGRASYSHGNTRLEILWTAAAAIVFVGLAIVGRNAWANLHFMGPAEGAVQVEAPGAQFEWQFRYAGPDGNPVRAGLCQLAERERPPLGLARCPFETT
jgi:cytochrome c oxidase subunit 2